MRHNHMRRERNISGPLVLFEMSSNSVAREQWTVKDRVQMRHGDLRICGVEGIPRWNNDSMEHIETHTLHWYP